MPRGIKFLLALVFVGALILRVEHLLRTEAAQTLLRYTDSAALVVGKVADDPDRRATSLRVALKVSTVNGEIARGTLLVSLPRETVLAYGQEVVVRGNMEAPQTFETETGRVFDYPGYLRVRGISAVMQYAELRESTEAPWSVRGALFAIKHAFIRSLERTVPEPHVALLLGMTLGERGGFPQEMMELFVVVGLVHIVVLSGSNISIVAEGVLRALSFLPKRGVLVAGGSIMVLFVVATGGGAAGVRALIMALIALLARYLNRPALALRALLVAGSAMLLWNPLVVTDSGFVLSILATFGLITLSPAIEARLGRLPAWKRFNIRSIVASTIAVNVFLLPALLYVSGVFSVVSLPVNMVVLPFVWVVMLGGFIAGLVGLVHPALALVPAFITESLLRAMVWVAEAAAGLPFASTVVGEFPLWLAALVYVPLTIAATQIYARTPASSRS